MSGAVAIALTGVLAAAGVPPGAGAGAIPTRPEDLRFGPLTFAAPDAGSFRHRLPGGVVVYLAEDHSLPLVEVSVLLRAGGFLDPPARPGVAELTGSLAGRGGTRRRTAAEFDEAVETLAARISTYGGETRSGATLNCLSPHLDQALDLFFEALATPAFAQASLEIERRRRRQGLLERRDDAGAVLEREWDWLLYGREHFSSRVATAPELAAVHREDLLDFHRRYWHPGNMVLAVAGDVRATEILPRLAAHLARWPRDGAETAPWPPPPPRHVPRPGLYLVAQEGPQSGVAIGHLGLAWEGRWAAPAPYAAAVMNQVLGGGGFTSRLVRRLRSEEGLVYGAESVLEVGTLGPGEFAVRLRTAPGNVTRAAQIAFEELQRLQDEAVSDDELEVARASLLAELAAAFSSPKETVGTFARDALLGRPHDYWRRYPERIGRVSAADVQRAAREHLRPEAAVVLVVGGWDAAGAEALAGLVGGPVHPLPRRDPLTLEPAP